MIAAWVAFLREAQAQGNALLDASAPELHKALNRPAGEDVVALLTMLDQDLADDSRVVARLEASIASLQGQPQVTF